MLGGVAAHAASGGGPLANAGGSIAAVGIVALVAALLLRVPLAIPWAVGLVAVGYVVAREHHHVVDGWAAVVGAALLLASELAWWSVGYDRRIREERALVLRQAVTVGALVATAAVVSFVLVGAAAVSTSAGLLLTAVGVTAAVAAIALVLRLVRDR